MPNQTGKGQEKLDNAPLWMWGIGLLGLVLVLGSIGFALYEAAIGDSSPPNVTVEVEDLTPTAASRRHRRRLGHPKPAWSIYAVLA